jgi:Uma2 family endonuclease
MVSANYPSIPQFDPPRSPRHVLPTMYDLPSEDPEEPGLPDEFHDLQPQLLSRTLSLSSHSSDNYFTASDLNLYYDVKHPLWHKRPDWFLAVGVPALYDGRDMRRSYVTWQEGKNPLIVVEFLSPGTEAEDLGRFYRSSDQIPELSSEPASMENPPTQPNGSNNGETNLKPPSKFTVYETELRVPHYIVYSRYTQQLRYFKLNGSQYIEMPLQAGNAAIWLEELSLGLGIWEGRFENRMGNWLRWCDAAGNWLLTDTEIEQQAKLQAQSKLAATARNLLSSGMAIAQIAALMELTLEELQELLETNN